MPNLHLDNNLKLLKNYLFSEYEKLLDFKLSSTTLRTIYLLQS